MTEAQWRTSTSPEAILNYLTDKASPRKLRLYAIGCCRRIWTNLHDERCWYAVEVAPAHSLHYLEAVQVGLFDDATGNVQVSGTAVHVGQRIVVPNI